MVLIRVSEHTEIVDEVQIKWCRFFTLSSVTPENMPIVSEHTSWIKGNDFGVKSEIQKFEGLFIRYQI